MSFISQVDSSRCFDARGKMEDGIVNKEEAS